MNQAQQVELLAQRYVYHLDKYAETSDADTWLIVTKILENAARKGVTSLVVDRAKALILADTPPKPGPTVTFL